MTKVSISQPCLSGHIPIHVGSTRTYLSRGGRVMRAEWAEPAAEWVEPAAQLSAAGQLEPQIPV